MSDAPALRHAGSADPMRSAREFTNQQYTATGVRFERRVGRRG